MTPDDEARLREPYCGPNEPPDETALTPQPRPSVLLEAGMALGLFPNRTVIVELGCLRPVSDILGRHTIRMDNSSERRQELAQRLETAGCAVNRSGTDWHTAGDFVSTLDREDFSASEQLDRGTRKGHGLPVKRDKERRAIGVGVLATAAIVMVK